VQSPGGATVKLPTTASVTYSLQTDASGGVTFPAFPAGLYTVTIVPPAAAAPGAVTTSSITLTTGVVTQSIALAQKVMLKGALSPQAGAAGAAVTAIDVGNACTGSNACATGAPATGTSTATGAVFSGQAGDDGTFALAVDPDRTYQIIVQPQDAGASTFGRAVLPPFRICSTKTAPCVDTNDGQLGAPIPLPAGMQYHGSLQGKGGVVAGALVQVFCDATSPTCADTTVSVAEVTSQGDGSFTVVLPVPAPAGAGLNK
ncbi:MAG TPA: hypothetical protein VH328_00715, partial [Burkholderiaceae bacterium]|jgi:hypothetical protein|nr:hypothetical protein [Burkholderiaceae bacterium]